MSTGRVLRAGTFRSIRPDDAGWRYLSLELLNIGPGLEQPIGGEGFEVAAVVLAGSCTVAVGGEESDLSGRTDVFDGPPWAVYLPAGARGVVHANAPCEVAVVGARSDAAGEPRVIAPGDVEVELRGAGSATRQIHHVVPPEFPAHRLLVVEVITPAGNWSSYPPHKHDEVRRPGEVQLEEFYCFRTRPRNGFGFQRVYSPSRGEDVSVAVHDGDAVLVPYGYHVSAAPHGIDLYYLNGLAGDLRSMAASDDPDLAWIRPTWEDMPKDPRLPLPWTPAAAR
ncbi:MAG: 5-deoxy-glucuronate isomerase [Actinomycetota bacterium]